jgi:hypothetical protein
LSHNWGYWPHPVLEKKSLLSWVRLALIWFSVVEISNEENALRRKSQKISVISQFYVKFKSVSQAVPIHVFVAFSMLFL